MVAGAKNYGAAARNEMAVPDGLRMGWMGRTQNRLVGECNTAVETWRGADEPEEAAGKCAAAAVPGNVHHTQKSPATCSEGHYLRKNTAPVLRCFAALGWVAESSPVSRILSIQHTYCERSSLPRGVPL
mmetsp:Transcript_11042/g.20469  ORF Transcript_11042/g.20469 Transcript_11042/m.20469 type:complete len:129 (+) Transcript_11042:3049-3435(+)